MKSAIAMLAFAVFSVSAAAQSLPAGHPSLGTKNAGQNVSEAQLPQKGKVISTLDAKPYIYVEVSQNKKTVWLAATAVPMKKGDVIRYDNGQVMTNWHSKSLNRTFPSVLFVNRVVVTKEKE
ncbi:MAG: hypothetical protein IH604_16335 [Burkholderiales bacterium]|nr:hypothetical protein [Burkholderiales bacterium]